MPMFKHLYPTAPFDFTKMLHRPLSRPARGIIVDLEKNAYSRCIRLEKRTCPVTVVSKGTVDEPMLEVSFPDDLFVSEQELVVETMQRMFDVDANLEGFYRVVGRDSVWLPLLHRLHGLRPIHDADLFESMVKVIVGQQLNVKFAATLVERLIDLTGETVTWSGNSVPVFPSAVTVADLSYEQLRKLSFSQRKAEYVIDFARVVAEDQIALTNLWAMSEKEIYDVLLPIRGIGRWTIECLILFGLGRRDVMPAADIGVQNAIQKLYGCTERPNEERVRQIAEDWKPWRSYAAYYLWQSLIASS